MEQHIIKLMNIVDELVEPYKRDIEKLCEYNTEKVLQAFINVGVGEEHLKGTTGYGYNDISRWALENVYKEIFNAEAAFVRPPAGKWNPCYSSLFLWEFEARR